MTLSDTRDIEAEVDAELEQERDEAGDAFNALTPIIWKRGLR
jgi:hypothetical protein